VRSERSGFSRRGELDSFGTIRFLSGSIGFDRRKALIGRGNWVRSVR
jgi:hypothetical protein